ncbi:MAG: hypothetical protein KAR31_01055 [Candidatus Omnitrophica bacterium]|nr:hypothetical protein [Candidatus Omnitrophota bacterium]
MNTKFLVFTSLLIAVLCHLFIFNFCTLIFSIDPGTPKPKLFFLGPILQQSDVDQSSPKNDADKQSPTASHHFGHNETVLKNITYEIADPEKQPFTIKTIRKPLVPQTTARQEKIFIKSTFELPSEEKKNKEVTTEKPGEGLNIQPYRPLRSRP